MNDFSLSLLGDSQFARWGTCLELQVELSRLYTHSTFELANYGLEGARIGNALHRICAPFERDGKTLPPLSFQNPRIVVLESCAHSQFWDGPEGLSEYRDLLRRAWDEIERTTTAKTLFCLSAPPPRDRFLEGNPLFFGTSKATRARHADGVKMYLDEARSIAEDEGWPLADIGEEIEKRVRSGESVRRFWEQHEGTSLSRYGFEAAARALVRELDNNRMVEERIQK
ncbi:hypothetical protein IAD21_04061 [Abditibacteriota bacterium]|nr:hypothetical protein IAD21_04061 [Abditibacteriota bacterium]